MAEVTPTPTPVPPAPKHRAILDLPELYARGPSYGAVIALGLILVVMIGGVLSVAVWLHSAATTQIAGVATQIASVDARLGQQITVVDTKANQSAVELGALRAELKAHREQTAQRFDAIEQRMDRGFDELKELIKQRRP